MIRQRNSGRIVVVLASGTERASLSAFIASLPEWLPAPLVVGLTDMDGPDDTLLGRLRHGCLLPVLEVKDEACELRGGQVYIDTEGSPLCVSNASVFASQTETATGASLLSSAAATFGADTVAVLLGGTIEASAVEARKVVWAGGTVFAHQLDEKPPALIRNGIARAYKSPENLAEAVGLVCSGQKTQRAV